MTWRISGCETPNSTEAKMRVPNAGGTFLRRHKTLLITKGREAMWQKAQKGSHGEM